MMLPTSIWRFLQREDGPTTVEYAVMLALIGAVVVAGATALGSSANGSFSSTSNSLGGASTVEVGDNPNGETDAGNQESDPDKPDEGQTVEVILTTE